MALPDDAMPKREPALFLPPDDIGRGKDRLFDYERGGVAVNDATAGLSVQNWRARVVDDDVLLSAEPYAAESPLLTGIADITEISLAFDHNMQPLVAYIADEQAALYWFDPQLNSYTTLQFDASSVFLTMDDKRAFSLAGNRTDVLLFYVRGGWLQHRRQRDRFSTEMPIGELPQPNMYIYRAGMSRTNRVQVEMRYPGQ